MAIDNYISVSEAAGKLGVSVQRMHQLIATYKLIVESVNPRMKLIPAGELRKIPEDRPSGVRLDRRKKRGKKS